MRFLIKKLYSILCNSRDWDKDCVDDIKNWPIEE